MSNTIKKKQHKKAPVGIPGGSTAPKISLRVKPIVESKIGFLLEIDRYSFD